MCTETESRCVANLYILHSGKYSKEKTLPISIIGSENFVKKIFTESQINRIGGWGKPKFCAKNFRGWLSNYKICEFSLSKVPTIQYYTYS